MNVGLLFDYGALDIEARLELPISQMDMVRSAARRRRLSLTGFIRMAVLEKAEEIIEDH